MAKGDDWLVSSESRHDLALRRLKAAARSLLAERGVDSFTADAVARRAGCSRATLYRVTGGSRALLDAVVADAGARVIDEVQRRVQGLTGPARAEEAVLATLDAIRGDPALRTWLAHRRTPGADDYFGSSHALSEAAALLSGTTALGPLAGPWLVRVVLALITWPLATPEEERRLVRSFVVPAFVGQPS